MKEREVVNLQENTKLQAMLNHIEKEKAKIEYDMKNLAQKLSQNEVKTSKNTDTGIGQARMNNNKKLKLKDEFIILKILNLEIEKKFKRRTKSPTTSRKGYTGR